MILIAADGACCNRRMKPFLRCKFAAAARVGAMVLLLGALAGCAILGPPVIYETPSMFGPLVVTDDGGGLRSMRFGRNGITQSTIKVGEPDYLRFDYLRLVLAGFALTGLPGTGAGTGTAAGASVSGGASAGAGSGTHAAIHAGPPRRILLVGLGGGALPVFLHRHYPALQIDVVEIVPEVVTVAEQYFGFRQDARMQAHVADGRAFIERVPAGQYDIIMLDAFGSAEVPLHLATQEFLQAVRRTLTPDGVVLSNVWNARYNRHYATMLRTYQEVFEEVHVVDTAREVNTMLYALPRAPALHYDSFIALARQHGAQQRYGFDLGELVQRGYLPVQRRDDVPVLRDAAVK